MQLIVWQPAYETGIDKIDSQHRYLFGLVNEFLTNDGYDIPNKKVLYSTTLQKLLQYVEHHFKVEEKMLEQAGYPDFEAHRNIHRGMEKRLKNYEQAFERDEFDYEAFGKFLREWMIDHVTHSDRDYISHVKSHPEVESLAA